VPPREVAVDVAGAESLALPAVSAWVLESQGLAASAEAARQAVMTLADKVTSADAAALVRAAADLCRDTSVRGLPIVDRPAFMVRPTHERGGR